MSRVHSNLLGVVLLASACDGSSQVVEQREQRADALESAVSLSFANGRTVDVSIASVGVQREIFARGQRDRTPCDLGAAGASAEGCDDEKCYDPGNGQSVCGTRCADSFGCPIGEVCWQPEGVCEDVALDMSMHPFRASTGETYLALGYSRSWRVPITDWAALDSNGRLFTEEDFLPFFDSTQTIPAPFGKSYHLGSWCNDSNDDAEDYSNAIWPLGVWQEGGRTSVVAHHEWYVGCADGRQALYPHNWGWVNSLVHLSGQSDGSGLVPTVPLEPESDNRARTVVRPEPYIHQPRKFKGPVMVGGAIYFVAGGYYCHILSMDHYSRLVGDFDVSWLPQATEVELAESGLTWSENCPEVIGAFTLQGNTVDQWFAVPFPTEEGGGIQNYYCYLTSTLVADKLVAVRNGDYVSRNLTNSPEAYGLEPFPYFQDELGRPTCPSNMLEWTARGYFHPTNIVREGDYYYLFADSIQDAEPVDPRILEHGSVLLRTRSIEFPDNWELYGEAGWEPVSTGSQGPDAQSPHVFFSSQGNMYTESRIVAIPSVSLHRHIGGKFWMLFGTDPSSGDRVVRFSETLYDPKFEVHPQINANVIDVPGPYWSIIDHSGATRANDFNYVGVDNNVHAYGVSEQKRIIRQTVSFNVSSTNCPTITPVGVFTFDGADFRALSPNSYCVCPDSLGTSQLLCKIPNGMTSVGACSAPCQETSCEDTSTVSSGVFDTGPGDYYSNGGAFCRCPNDVDGSRTLCTLPRSMTFDGECNGECCIPPATVSAGLFLVGSASYYSNGGQYCSCANYIESERAYCGLPTAMQAAGSCGLCCAATPPVVAAGHFTIQSTSFYSNGGQYCQCPNFIQYDRLYCSLPDAQSMPYAGMCLNRCCEDTPAAVPAGHFNVGQSAYYSNGGAFCRCQNYVEYDRIYCAIPSQMQDAGSCGYACQ
jgi:hypothetical protein